MKVKDILKKKGPEVITIGSQKTIHDAINTLVKHRIGALIVLDETGRIIGIISERDILKESHKSFSTIKETKIENVMTKNIIIGTPEDDLDYVECIMTENRIRHLPIIANKRLIGIISIGDILKTHLKEVEVENRYLKDYITGKY